MKTLTDVVLRPRPTTVTDPPVARFLFGDVRMAWLWFVLRVWLGWSWLSSGWEKFQSPAWIDGRVPLREWATVRSRS
ncbi:MAG: hypothetical protein GEU73_14625 [Chloroflexi bacterium]|nr:hypothetical protein [Chloroflexota bacterium]